MRVGRDGGSGIFFIFRFVFGCFGLFRFPVLTRFPSLTLVSVRNTTFSFQSFKYFETANCFPAAGGKLSEGSLGLENRQPGGIFPERLRFLFRSQ